MDSNVKLHEMRLVWSCFLWYGLGPLQIVHGTLNSERYKNILDNRVVPTLWQYFGNDDCYFQDDNTPCHVSASVKQWYTYGCKSSSMGCSKSGPQPNQTFMRRV